MSSRSIQMKHYIADCFNGKNYRIFILTSQTYVVSCKIKTKVIVWIFRKQKYRRNSRTSYVYYVTNS